MPGEGCYPAIQLGGKKKVAKKKKKKKSYRELLNLFIINYNAQACSERRNAKCTVRGNVNVTATIAFQGRFTLVRY